MFQRKKPVYYLPKRSFKQKQYFSLMLVPSYSYGKTRSIRFSYKSLFAVLFTFLAIFLAILFFFVQSRSHQQTITYVFANLEQTQVAYESLQENVEQEQEILESRLIYLQNNIT